jgi:tetratricopeptide (TPR) repeat protein
MDMGKPAEALVAYQKARDIQQQLADAQPAVTQFRRNLAIIHRNIGGVLLATAKPAEALVAYQKARDIQQQLVDAQPAVTQSQSELATTHNYLGRLQAWRKRFPEAFAALDKGLALRHKLADAHPGIPLYTNHLAYSHAYRGWAHVRAGHPAEAAADLRRAVALWSSKPTKEGVTLFEISRALALLAGLGGDLKSGVTAAEAVTCADRAVAALADAVKAGWAPAGLDDPRGPDFDALRSRDDFKKLIDTLAKKSPAEAQK